MKISKFHVIVLALLVSAVIFTFALWHQVQAYEAWKDAEYPPEIRPWVDFAQFWQSSYATPFNVIAVVLGFCWIAAVPSTLKGRKQSLVMVLGIVLLASMFFMPVFARAC